MKKFLLFSLLFILFLSTVVNAASPTGTTIDLSECDTVGGTFCKGYGKDTNNTYNYILAGSGIVLRYLYNDFSYDELTASLSGLSYIGMDWNTGKNKDAFLFRTGNAQIKNYEDLGATLGQINTIDLNNEIPLSQTPLSNIKDIEIFQGSTPQLFVLDPDTDSITVFSTSYTSPAGFLVVSWLYTINTSNLSVGSSIHMGTYDNELFVFDEETLTITRINKLGDVIQTIPITNITQSRLMDVFNWNNTWWILDQDAYIAREYDIELISPPSLYDGYYYNVTNYCTSNDYLCNDTNITITEFGTLSIVCNDPEDRTLCNDGCTNELNNYLDGEMYNGVCETLPCEDECTTLNEYVCTTINTYSQCVRGLDGCADLLQDFYCPINQYCTEGQCDAVTINKSGLWTQEGLTPNIKVNTTNAYETKIQNAESFYDISSFITSLIAPKINKKVKAYYMKTVNNKLQTTIDTLTLEQQNGYYRTVSCDFTNDLLEEDYLQHNNLIGNGWTTTSNIIQDDYIYYLQLNNSQATKNLQNSLLTQEIEIMFKPETTSYTTIQYKDGEYEVGEIYIYYNESEKRLIIGETNYGKVFLNDTSLQPTDDLQRVVLVSRHLNDIDSSHYEILVIRKPLETDVITRSFGLPIQYTSSSASVPDNINITTNGLFDIYQTLQWEQEGMNSYETVSEYSIPQTCEYTQATCKNVRAWVNYANIPTYHFYDDIQVCATQLNGLTNLEEQAKANGNETLTIAGLEIKNFGLKAAIFLLIATVALTLIIYFDIDDNSQKNAILVVGIIIFGLEIFYFASIGVIEAWWIGLLIVIAAAAVILIGKRRM